MSKKADFSIMFAQSLQEKLSDIKSGKINISAPQSTSNDLNSLEGYLYAEQGAALSNWFLPETLFDQAIQRGRKESILSQLSMFCSVKKTDKIEWLLDKNKRITVLEQLIDSETLSNRLNSQLPKTDRTGIILREIMSGVYGTDVNETDRNELLSLSNALELISRINTPKPSLSEVRIKLEGKFLSEYDILLKDFVGRQVELKQLTSFLLQESTSQRSFQSIVLWGLGGAGKSTILARFLQQVSKKKHTTVIVLDFDKPGIDASDTYWLEVEITKQLGQQHPELRDEFNSYRTIARRENIKNSSMGAISGSTKHRLETSILSRAIDRLKISKYKVNRLLLVLDTLEEVSQREHSIALIDWLYSLSSNWVSIDFKVIFSGRLFDKDRATFKGVSEGREVPVEEFDSKVSRNFLKNQGLSEKNIKIILGKKLFPFRPLELKLIARVIKHDPNFSWKEFENEAAKSSGAQKEFFLGIVYRRVLSRIENPVSRKLAYPGLVLRYLTVPLVQEVLIPVINNSGDTDDRIPTMTNQDTEQALNELALYGWLSYRGPNNEVYHRKDLRRSMLRLMINNDKEKADMLHKKAIEYFSNGITPSDQSEVLYHRLMLFDERGLNPEITIEQIVDAKTDISQDILDLPEPAAVLVRFALQNDVKLSDIDLLPDRYFTTAYSEVGKKMVRSGSYGRIGKLIARRARTDEFRTLEFWEAEALFKTVSWSLLRNLLRYITIVEGRSYIRSNAIDRYFYNFFIESRLSNSKNSRKNFIDITRHLMDLVFYDKRYNPRGLFQKIAHCCVRINATEQLCQEELEFIDKFLKWYHRTKTTGYDASCDRAINLIEFVSNPKKSNFLCTPGSIKLHPRWLVEMKDYLGVNKALLKDAAECLLPNKQRLMSVKRILSGVDSLARNKIKARFYVPINKKKLSKSKLVSLLRGPDHEFRDLCRYALLEYYHKTEHYIQLSHIFKRVISLPVEDFDDGTFLQLMQTDPEKCLEDYIEITDRCWALGKLLQLTTNEKPRGSKLALVYAKWKQWNNSVRLTVTNAILSPMSLTANKAAKKTSSRKKNNH